MIRTFNDRRLKNNHQCFDYYYDYDIDGNNDQTIEGDIHNDNDYNYGDSGDDDDNGGGGGGGGDDDDDDYDDNGGSGGGGGGKTDR